ncbi:DUF1338 domain-containing protein [Siphonobacter sp. BAB-5405]|uniref:DUF1338 domain-containing protein n=1 Tax=Siphonobacter sp. BAB-5405 TaxID=1864825 RepID=UPI000C802516|nr:DUF1338 domain-containing protein [Siphonobacter sp. BAB-5405]PMD89855.1 DUF1338 domain-containing protein [Siphonobacter sp. BAB-5405]
MTSPSSITQQLLDRLWERYQQRVPYARRYAALVLEKGGQVVNDHCAFRTFNTRTGEQTPGLEAIGFILECLGYQKISPYAFPTKYLNSWHYQHPTEAHFPKFFVTQLDVTQLSGQAQQLLSEAVTHTPDLLAGTPRELLQRLKDQQELEDESAVTLVSALENFFTRPWPAPRRETVLALNEESQFAAWTLLHGNAVNHFTAYINFQQVPEWPDLETTIAGLQAAGIPMKSQIEGERGSKLRQSSTQAVDEDCPVTEADGSTGTLRWSYAYYELAERGQENGVWFEGFLGDQATNLFEMTKR